MTFEIEFTEQAIKELKKMDKHDAPLITGWIRKNLKGCSNPRQHGKALTANHSGEWRYRVGNYRLLAEIQDEKVIILILTIGHRSKIYL